MIQNKSDKIWEALKEWARDHKYGKICAEFTVHQGEIVGMEEVPERTKKEVRI